MDNFVNRDNMSNLAPSLSIPAWQCLVSTVWTVRGCVKECYKSRNIPTPTLWRWYRHFLLFGETVPETNLWKNDGICATRWHNQHWHFTTLVTSGYLGFRKNYNNATMALLDETQQCLLGSRGHMWATSTIWNKMMTELCYSLVQVVSYIVHLHPHVFDENMLMHISCVLSWSHFGTC